MGWLETSATPTRGMTFAELRAEMEARGYEHCEFYEANSPCEAPAVETLVFCNPLTAGKGVLRACARHLAEYVAHHFLKEKP